MLVKGRRRRRKSGKERRLRELESQVSVVFFSPTIARGRRSSVIVWERIKIRCATRETLF
jgi:hypothetical protein